MNKRKLQTSIFNPEGKIYLEDLIPSTKNKIKNEKPIDELTDDEQISIVSNAMFFTMLCNESRKKFTCKFLSLLLNCDYEELLNNSFYYKNELDKDHVKTKAERADLVIKIGEDYINVEMNSRDETNRNIEYADRFYRSPIKVGSKYIYPKILSININNYYYEEFPKVIEKFKIQSDEGVGLIYKESIHIYLPKLFEKWYNEGEKNLEEYEKMLLAMSMTDRKQASELAKDSDIMKEYIKEAKTVERNDDFLRQAYDHELSDRLASFEEGYDVMTTEIITNMVKKGVDMTNISHLTNLPKEKIEKIIKEEGLLEEYEKIPKVFIEVKNEETE